MISSRPLGGTVALWGAFADEPTKRAIESELEP